MSTAVDRALSEVAQLVLSHLLDEGEATRKLLAEKSELSFPTVTLALAELTARSMVSELRREQGARGRATIVYGVSDDCGWILGVDIGSTQISFNARLLNGRVLANESHKHEEGPEELGRLAGKIVANSTVLKAIKTPPLVVALALNQVVPRQLLHEDKPRPLALEIAEMFVAASRLPYTIPFLLENNVNCAAVAEHQEGLMRGYDDAAYMQIGVGIGLGYFADGSLIRGGQGASGELAQIPLSWSVDIVSEVDAIERRYGSLGLMQSVCSAYKDADMPDSPEALFLRAAGGDKTARMLMSEHGVALGRLAATAAAILDPEIIVLGGGLARNEAFAQIIAKEFRSRNNDTQLEVSKKGAEATVLGACLLARDLAIGNLVERFHKPLSARPTILPL
ncbi:ROK family protein [Agrobacterium larrymoorei]|uniref:ROK family protein n=1 Tax=Agrobacterium larrymoorei TaxID=160699 RepID=A0ABX8TCQ1_9HYPH|nr:ROK family protein [Agrobacterium larrymoorei]QYA09964.1 ROK family protein [Agrobacterium larrymoorei]